MYGSPEDQKNLDAYYKELGISTESKLVGLKDMVNKPSHYQSGKFEVIDVIEAFHLDFHLGNATKYILRAGKKDPNKTIEDLEKAVYYIERKIKNLEQK